MNQLGHGRRRGMGRVGALEEARHGKSCHNSYQGIFL